MGKVNINTEQGLSSPYNFRFWMNLLVGPILFILLQATNIPGLDGAGQLVLGLYLWIIAWWVLQPVPWGVASLLPLVILPMTNIMRIGDVAALYGQRLMFFHMGVLLLGFAVQKHGLGKRIALNFLNIPWVGTSVLRILFAYLTIVAVISAFVDDAPAIAIAIPIGMSIVNYAVDVTEKLEGKKISAPKMKAFMALGVLYAAEAGGIMTVGGIPHIATTIGVLEQTVKRTISYAQWFSVGIFLGIASLVVYFVVLYLFLKPEIRTIHGAQDFFIKEKDSMGPMNRGERNTLIAFVVMVFLWFLPAFVKVKFLDIWIVPIIGLILLYVLPINENEHTLSAKDLQVGLPWNVMLLALTGGVLSTVASNVGIIDWIQSGIPTNLSGLGLAFTAGVGTAGLSNFISGVAAVSIMGNIFFPIANQMGLDPSILARILPATGMAIMLPWAGAATATAFSTGTIEIPDMIKVGFIATIAHLIIVVLLSYLLVPLFNASSLMF